MNDTTDTPPKAADGGRNPADHELRYVAAASISVCEECGATFETTDLEP